MFVNSLLGEFWYGLFIGVRERFKRFCMIKKRKVKVVYKRLIVGRRNNITLKIGFKIVVIVDIKMSSLEYMNQLLSKGEVNN